MRAPALGVGWTFISPFVCNQNVKYWSGECYEKSAHFSFRLCFFPLANFTSLHPTSWAREGETKKNHHLLFLRLRFYCSLEGDPINYVRRNSAIFLFVSNNMRRRKSEWKLHNNASISFHLWRGGGRWMEISFVHRVGDGSTNWVLQWFNAWQRGKIFLSSVINDSMNFKKSVELSHKLLFSYGFQNYRTANVVNILLAKSCVAKLIKFNEN